MGTKKKDLQKSETMGSRFTNMVIREFQGQVGGELGMTREQQVLAQHLFIGIDKQLRDLEAKRIKANQTKRAPIVWANLNMEKLAMDAVHRIDLGLDALIPNHIHPVPYWNSKLLKYDLDLAVGYVGKDFYKRTMALDPPTNIIYELVYETDDFRPIKKDHENNVESYSFCIQNPFQRGPVVGGFGYIEYADPKKNKLVIVTKEDMIKSRKLAKSDAFWAAHEENMQMVVVVRRTTAFIKVDPRKVNASYSAVELDDNQPVIMANANQGNFIDLVPEPFDATDENQTMTEEPKVKTDQDFKEAMESKEEEEEPPADLQEAPSF